MNFTQWKGHAAKQSVAKITYCCGEERTLVELVVQDIKSILQVPETDFIVLDEKIHNEVWEQASRYSFDPKANRLIIIRSAELFSEWEYLDQWILTSKFNPKTYLLFIDNSADAPYEWAKGKKLHYKQHVETIRAKGKFIKCSTPNAEDLVKFCCSYGLSEKVAEHLVKKSSGNIPAMYQVLRKLHIWNSSPSSKVIDLLCESYATMSFADCLLLHDKQSAYSLLDTSDLDPIKIITELNYKLDMMVDISRCLRRRMYDVDIASTTGIKIFTIKKFKHVAKAYDFNTVKRCRQLLAFCDAGLQDGANSAVMETLISSW
jgi:DNA polymerase III delta subunit